MSWKWWPFNLIKKKREEKDFSSYLEKWIKGLKRPGTATIYYEEGAINLLMGIGMKIAYDYKITEKWHKVIVSYSDYYDIISDSEAYAMEEKVDGVFHLVIMTDSLYRLLIDDAFSKLHEDLGASSIKSIALDIQKANELFNLSKPMK